MNEYEFITYFFSVFFCILFIYLPVRRRINYDIFFIEMIKYIFVYFMCEIKKQIDCHITIRTAFDIQLDVVIVILSNAG